MNTGNNGQYHEIKHQGNNEVARGQGEAKPRPAKSYDFHKQANLLKQSQNANQARAFHESSFRTGRTKAKKANSVEENEGKSTEESLLLRFWRFFG